MNKILSQNEIDSYLKSLCGRVSYIDALLYATRVHQGQVRKFTNYPYIVHCFEVMCILQGHGVQDQEVLCAGLLHDTIEDTSATYDEISSLFGARVADLVKEVTNVSKEDDGYRSHRKSIDRAHLSKASIEGKMVKLADIISNTMSISCFDRLYAKLYLAEKKNQLKVLKIDHPLYETAVLTIRRSVTDLRRQVVE